MMISCSAFHALLVKKMHRETELYYIMAAEKVDSMTEPRMETKIKPCADKHSQNPSCVEQQNVVD